jgi:hypothetical protein
VFGELKKHLKGKNFSFDDEIQKAVALYANYSSVPMRMSSTGT